MFPMRWTQLEPQMRVAAELMDEINREAWRTHDAVALYSKLEGWTDPGERAAVEAIAAQVKGQPILDLGVGGGRTVPLLRRISQDYTAVDYTPELVAACRHKYPELRVRCADARDLSAFDDDSFGLVVFSFNGIDSVNPGDRMKVLRETHRVLRRGGILLFSSHNQRGPGHGEGLKLGVSFTRNPFKLAIRIARALTHCSRAVSNYRRYSGLKQFGEGYSIRNAAALDHGIVVHYVTVETQCAQLAAAGFCPEVEIYGNLDGQLVSCSQDSSRHMWLHFIARKS
jgi:ubiquinone/menaquinone biosynthesis C-methylase UbiE